MNPDSPILLQNPTVGNKTPRGWQHSRSGQGQPHHTPFQFQLQPSYSSLAFTGDNISNDQKSDTSGAMHTYHGELKLALHARTCPDTLTPSLAAHVWNDEIARNRRDRSIFQRGGSGI
ncbi:hypothetical protein N7499_012926 [Penicillium canescens]|uniref:uncharacterized protein n=1 Tax=Penicillium canescens TaxID=5083 RepID=UPI0026E06645|nr:uncharacterized protein N7446_000428 [Penicillium canescens]KAJ6012104.1 hypothetical protein N7522_002459 [Penicillium canescens]KAJ6064246.1 hypothetical protein N7499_012926 [Penicillium canescens]KAJ6077492.1 hypothetical protein N7446_000428 [Penicillium canescens]KAJ6154259.1 hypothetical protein N7485_012628 [Penicillium canescens]